MKKSLFLAVGALSLWMGVARADGNAELIQRSYDSEATGRLADSLSVLDQLSAPRRDAYVVTLRKAWLLSVSYTHLLSATSSCCPTRPKD